MTARHTPHLLLPAAAAIGLLAVGCRGDTSREPPVHLIQDMDQQDRYEAQEPNPFYVSSGGRAMRDPVPGTVARGELHEDDHLYRGRIGTATAQTLPMDLTPQLLGRGQARFSIYCAPCHDAAGTGKGIIVSRGMLPPPSFHDDRLRAMPVGEFFNIISDGVRNMPSYGSQIPVEDRWAIAAYVRALQISRNAELAQVPMDIAAQKGWSAK